MAGDLPAFSFRPIGFFRGAAARKYDAPRQGAFATGGEGAVELLPGRNFETALRDLDGFGRVWIIFVFDRNGGAWRPTARPPVRAPGCDRVGLFATRAPYRPNPIGLTCARLVGVRGLRVEVAEADLLDGTPVLDLKPSVAAARLQLSLDPFDATRKRVAHRDGPGEGTLALRMFRIDFRADPATPALLLERVRSAYSPADLADPADPHGDKELHRAFLRASAKPGA